MAKRPGLAFDEHQALAGELRAINERLLGVDRSRVSQLLRQGLPTTAEGKIELEQGLRWIVARVGQGRYGDGAAARARALLRAIERRSGDLPEHPDEEVPPRMRWLARLRDDPVRFGIAAGAVEMVYRVPALAACAAVEAGASLQTAFALKAALKVAMAEEALDVAGLPDGVAEWHLNHFWEVDWDRLGAERPDEPVDVEQWRDHLRAISIAGEARSAGSQGQPRSSAR